MLPDAFRACWTGLELLGQYGIRVGRLLKHERQYAFILDKGFYDGLQHHQVFAIVADSDDEAREKADEIVVKTWERAYADSVKMPPEGWQTLLDDIGRELARLGKAAETAEVGDRLDDSRTPADTGEGT